MSFKQKGYGILLLYILTITRCLRGQARVSTGKIVIHTPVEFTESTQNPLSRDSASRNDKLTHDIPTRKTNVRQTNQSRISVEMPAQRQLHETKPGEIGESYENVRKYKLSQDFEELNRSRLSGRKRMVVFNDKNGKYHSKQHEERHSEDLPFNSYSNIDCIQGKIHNLHRGKFSITGNDENHSQMAYHSDSVTPGVRAGKVRGEIAKAEESWMRMEPEVECGDETMTLTVRGRRAIHLLVDRANASAVPLAKLPSQCGYSVESTWRDLTFVVPYNACHVKQEEDGSYVLPLIWRGTPVKMSCPVSQAQALTPSSLCCSSQGMTVRLQVHGAKEEFRVKGKCEVV
uniref:ZP domain-containing protein n=2 Tax=Hucho hucho TaxID=62062 RepID=A0A4W5PJI7_9TELE